MDNEIAANPAMLSTAVEETRGRIISGTRWATVGQGGAQLLRFLVSLALARLLVPADFGLMSMALLFVGLMELFKDLGTVSALIQAPELPPVLLNSVFYLNVLVGLGGCVILYLGAPWAASFFVQPSLTAILRVLATTLLISSLGLVMRALLSRNLQFGRLAFIDFVGSAAYGLVAVGMALAGARVWSLVFGSLASSVLGTALLWFASGWRPGFAVRLGQLRQILNFSASMTGTQVFGYLIFQTDKLLIGRFMGDSALGLYSMAQRLLEVPLNFVTQPILKVLFPAFSGIQNEHSQIGVLYSRACGAIALLTLPLLASLVLLSEPFVSLVLGEKWRPTIPLIVILTLPAAIQTVAMTVGSIYMAKGKANWLFFWQVGAGILTVIGMLIGLRFGISGLAMAYATVITLLTYPAFAIPFRLIRFPMTAFVRSMSPFVLGAGLMIAVGLGVRWIGRTAGVHPLPGDVMAWCAGLGAYIAVIALTRPPALIDIREFLLPKRLQLKVPWNR